MGAKEMVERIKEEADEESKRIISEAKAAADKKLEEAKATLELQNKRFIEAEERKGVEEKERVVRAARRNARKFKWMAEEETINKALDAALDRIKVVKSGGFKGTSYPKILAGLIKDSTLSMVGGSSTDEEVEVLLSDVDADAAYIDQAVLTKLGDEISRDSGVNVLLSLADDRIKSVGGVIVRRKDGKIEVNNTFEQRIARFSTSLREEIVKTLFKKT